MLQTTLTHGRAMTARTAKWTSVPDAARINPWLFWRQDPIEPEPQILTVAELADCRCPDLCNRDHANE